MPGEHAARHQHAVEHVKQQNDLEYFRNRPLLVRQKRRYSKFAHEVLLYDSLTARGAQFGARGIRGGDVITHCRAAEHRHKGITHVRHHSVYRETAIRAEKCGRHITLPRTQNCAAVCSSGSAALRRPAELHLASIAILQFEYSSTRAVAPVSPTK